MRFFLAAALALGSVASLLSPPTARGGEADREPRERGRYLASIMDCTGCHTPGALRGQPEPQRALSGSDVGFKLPGLGIFYPPNLTSDALTGLGAWSVDQIVTAVRSGVRPDGRILVPIMPYHSYAVLSDGDAKALAIYLKSLPPVRNAVPPPVGDKDRPPAPYLTLALPD